MSIHVPVYRLPYSQKDISYVNENITRILERGYLTDGGPTVSEFENKWNKFLKIENSISVNSCTTGLQAILQCIGIENKSVIVPNYTFYASPMSVINEGGRVIFCDISKETLSISLEAIKKSVREDTKAVMIVHVGGIITDEIHEIREYCDRTGLYLIEDAACAAGSEFKGKKAGTFGHASVFSFHHSKVLTTGEGGMICTNNEDWAQQLRKIRAIGLDRSINNWEVFCKGSNYKMSEISAVLGILHTNKAPQIIKERQDIAERYDNEIIFRNGISKFVLPEGCESSYYKYVIRTANSKIKQIIKERMSEANVELPPSIYDYNCNKCSFSKHERVLNDDAIFPNSEYMSEHHFCLNMYNGLLSQEIDHIIKSINNITHNL